MKCDPRPVFRWPSKCGGWEENPAKRSGQPGSNRGPCAHQPRLAKQTATNGSEEGGKSKISRIRSFETLNKINGGRRWCFQTIHCLRSEFCCLNKQQTFFEKNRTCRQRFPLAPPCAWQGGGVQPTPVWASKCPRWSRYKASARSLAPSVACSLRDI